jgi:hypothetical protein
MLSISELSASIPSGRFLRSAIANDSWGSNALMSSSVTLPVTLNPNAHPPLAFNLSIIETVSCRVTGSRINQLAALPDRKLITVSIAMTAGIWLIS